MIRGERKRPAQWFAGEHHRLIALPGVGAENTDLKRPLMQRNRREGVSMRLVFFKF
jgi:hypothetical protein